MKLYLGLDLLYFMEAKVRKKLDNPKDFMRFCTKTQEFGRMQNPFRTIHKHKRNAVKALVLKRM